MTGFGPWIQDGDYEATNEATVGVDRWRTEYAEVVGNYGDISEGTYVGQTLGVSLAAPTEPWTAGTFGFPKFFYRWIQDEVSPSEPILGQSEIRIMHEAYRYVTVSPWTTGAIYFTPDSVPAGVVGVQYEGDDTVYSLPHRVPAEIVAAELTGSLAYTFEDSRDPDDHLLSGDAFVSALIADAGESFDSGTEPPPWVDFVSNGFIDEGVWDNTNAGGPTSSHDVIVGLSGPDAADYTTPHIIDPIDITGYLDAMGRVILYTKMDFDSADPIIGATAEMPPDPGITGQVGYGYHLGTDMEVVWTFRPPPYRFAYQGTGKPLRLYPRDDNLGNSPRLYPPPRTRQRSNRISGYL